MNQRFVIVGAAVALTVSATVFAQDAKSAPPMGPPALAIPRELALEEQLQIARDERDQILNQYEALRLQAQQLSAIVDQFIAQAQSDRISSGNASRKEVSDKLIRAMGGDPDKGDVWNWKDRALVKRDGTVVSIPKPDKKPEGPQ